MTPEQIIERARLVQIFLESDEFRQAWDEIDADLVREFRGAIDQETALRVHGEMQAMERLMLRWKRRIVDATIARNDKKELAKRWFR